MRYYRTVIAAAALTLTEAAVVLPAAAQDRDGRDARDAAVVTDALDVHSGATPVERRGLVRQVNDDKAHDEKVNDDRAHDDKAKDDKAGRDDKAHSSKAAGHHHSKRAGNRTAAGSVEMLSALRRAQREKGNK